MMVSYRPLSYDSAEVQAVHQLIKHVFDGFVARYYTPEGVKTLHRFIEPEEIIKRHGQQHNVVVAESEGNIVGMIEYRACSHIVLLFVHEDFQHQGVGRGLIADMLEECCEEASEIATVSSAPRARAFYKTLGFRPTSEEPLVEDGMVYTPMAIKKEELCENIKEREGAET